MNRIFYRYIILLLMVFFCMLVLPVHAAVILNDTSTTYPLGLELDILEDPGSTLTIDDVVSSEYNERFIKSRVKVPNYGFTNSAYWVRVKIRNKIACRWVLETGYANMHYIDYYALNGTGIEEKKTGVLRPVETRDLHFHRFVFQPEIPAGSERLIYLRFKSQAAMNIALSIRSEASFLSSSLEEHLIWGGFYGILLIMFFYNLFLYITLRDNAYLYFVLALFFSLLQHLSYNGIGPLYIWYDNLLLNRIGVPLFDNCLMIFMLLFGSVFLEIPKRSPRLQSLFKIMICFSIILIITIPFAQYGLMIQLTLLLMIPVFLITIYAGIISWLAGYRPARYYLTGWFVLLFGGVIFILNNFGILPSSFFTNHTFEFGAVWLLLFGALGLSDRINLFKTETDIANTELRIERDKLQALIDGLADMDIGVAIISEKKNIIYQNSILTKWFGEISHGCCYEKFFNNLEPCRNCSASKALLSGETKHMETRMADGRIFEIISTPLSIRESAERVVIEVIIDISERKRNQEVMIQTEKMMTLGGMAAGMAHEINNPLAGIMQNQQIIFNRFSEGFSKNNIAAEQCGVSLEGINAYLEKREILKMMNHIYDSSKRACQVIDNMLSFSRNDMGTPETTDLKDLLDRTIELAVNDSNFKFRGIKINREYDPALQPVMCQPVKIQQVLLNLLQNGAHAMVEGNTEEPCFNLRLKPEAEMVRIEVENNGPGMTKEVCRRIFEPFYTTKDKGKGTGLGLSISYFIITDNHNGEMKVESGSETGVKFIIILPYN